jgi:hypothetical protein
MAQFLLIALVLIFELKEYFIARSHQLAPHIAGSNETGQAIITVMVAIEFLFHPLSLFLLYLALEGAVRFLGSLITAEIVPSLLVFLFFKYPVPRLGLSDAAAAALSSLMLWICSRTAGYGLLLPVPRPDGMPASLLESMANGLNWSVNSGPSHRVQLSTFCGPRQWEKFCAATRNMTRPGR